MASSTKKTKYECKYKPEIEKTFNFVRLSKKSIYSFYCLTGGGVGVAQRMPISGGPQENEPHFRNLHIR